jgi:hypothetical protein
MILAYAEVSLTLVEASSNEEFRFHIRHPSARIPQPARQRTQMNVHPSKRVFYAPASSSPLVTNALMSSMDLRCLANWIRYFPNFEQIPTDWERGITRINVLSVTLIRFWVDLVDSSYRIRVILFPSAQRILCSGLCRIDSEGRTWFRFLRNSMAPFAK